MENEVDFKREILTNVTIETELYYLQKQAAILLGEIQIHEDYIYYLKEHLKVDEKEINKMKEMVFKFFCILALIDAYEFFQGQNLLLTNETMDLFVSAYNNDYEIRISKFINDITLGKMKEELMNITTIDFETGLELLKWQTDNLLYQMFLEETNQNPKIDVINWIIKRVFRSLSTFFVLKDEKTHLNIEQLKQAIDEKYMKYLYKFGRKLPKAVVKVEKLNFE